MAQTLAFAHERGVVHRDVKPQNVLVGPHGRTILLDWGIAKVKDVPETARLEPQRVAVVAGHEPTQAGEVFGTVGYMAPEQALGLVDEIDARTDVFALGALLYHVLAGRAPYHADSLPRALAMASEASAPRLAEVARDAPRGLCRIVETAMARERSARYASAVELARALEAYTADALGAEAGRWVEILATAVSVLSIAVVVAVARLVASPRAPADRSPVGDEPRGAVTSPLEGGSPRSMRVAARRWRILHGCAGGFASWWR